MKQPWIISCLVISSLITPLSAQDADEWTALPDLPEGKWEPGVVNLDLSKHVSSMGLFYAPDPSSQISCTITIVHRY